MGSDCERKTKHSFIYVKINGKDYQFLNEIIYPKGNKKKPGFK